MRSRVTNYSNISKMFTPSQCSLDVMTMYYIHPAQLTSWQTSPIRLHVC